MADRQRTGTGRIPPVTYVAQLMAEPGFNSLMMPLCGAATPGCGLFVSRDLAVFVLDTTFSVRVDTVVDAIYSTEFHPTNAQSMHVCCWITIRWRSTSCA